MSKENLQAAMLKNLPAVGVIYQLFGLHTSCLTSPEFEILFKSLVFSIFHQGLAFCLEDQVL